MIDLTNKIIAEWRILAAEREGLAGVKKMQATRRANRVYDKLWKLSRKFPEVERHLDTIEDGPIYL